jgi:hypothetical protein
LVDTFIGFAPNSFAKQQATACRISNEFQENPRKLFTSMKKGIKIEKRIVHALSVVKRVLQIQKHLVLSN